MELKPDNFWYAVNSTEIIMLPKTHLETFGATNTHYFMVSELMDTIGQIRVREGAIKSERPQIITPSYYEQEVLEGFGEDARQYMQWLKANSKYLHILQYGIKIQKTEINENIVSGESREVIDKVKEQAARASDPHTAVVFGVDDYWEVSLLKLMRDVVTQSIPANTYELRQKRMFDDVDGVPRAIRDQVENSFAKATKDPSLISSLHDFLKKNDLFEEYEDRFFALVRYSKKK